MDEDENFLGYDKSKFYPPIKIQMVVMCTNYSFYFCVTAVCRKKFSDTINKKIVSRLVSEAGKLDSSVPLIQLRGN